MASSNSRKHARKVTLDAAVSNAIEKAVDARKVAAFTVGAAGVLAGAAFAFGATPAMAAETGAAAEPAKAPVAAGEKAGAGKKAAAGKSADAKPEAKETVDKETAKQEQTVDKAQTEANKEAGEQSVKKEDTTEEQNKQSVVKADDKKSDEEKKKQEITTAGQDRASGGAASQDPSKITPAAQADGSTKINIDENNAGTMPNMYGWGSSDNTFSEDGEKHTVTFHFAAPKDGKITNIAIFPAQNNGLNNDKSRKGAEYYSGDATMRQSFSGTYEFTKNGDGSATLTMSNLFSKGTVNGGAEKYVASRSIFVYVTNKDGKEDVAYKTNVYRAVTLVPPKTSGSVVLKYNEQLTPEKVQAAITSAGNINTERSDKKSVNNQLSGTFTQNINVGSSDAYDKTTFDAINKETSGKDAKDKTYETGAKTLNTYMVTDLGFKSQAIPLTVARYDDRIDKPIVEDPTQLSKEVKEDIAKKLAKINGVTPDQITFDNAGNVVINFYGVDAKDAPTLKLSDLVLKQLKEADVNVPTGEKAVFVTNPLGYSKAELDRIKTAIFEANKDNDKLGLTSKDQITLSYITGDLTSAGDANKGRSNGLQENNISVTIKTDKALAEFTSDITKDKLTRLPDIRKDYTVELVKNKLDGRDSDEGFSWSDDKHTTLIYRYDPTKAQAFTAPEILKLIKATPNDNKSGLRELTGGELLGYEGTGSNAQKSHMHYALQNGEPTNELTLGMMDGPYWIGNPQVANSDVNMGDEESKVGQYTWDTEAGSLTVAAKQNKVFKTRLFVAPYALTYYRGVYTNPYRRDPNNTPKAINVIFVPQTNHKTKDLKTSVEEHKTVAVEGNEVPTQSAYYNASDKVKSDYDDALKVAKDLYEQVKDKKESDLTEKQKADIDNATIKLDKARKALDGDATKKEELQKSIDENGKAAAGTTAATGTQATNQFKNVSDPDFKTPEGKSDEARNNAAKEAKKAYDKALEEAKKLKDDANATQKAVDAAKAKLDAARAKLNEFTTNKDELSAAIAKDGKVNTGKTESGTQDVTKADPTYQNSSDTEREAYDKAVAEAQKVVADPNASQKEVNDAIKKLKDAKDALDKNATNKAPLDAAVQKSFDNNDGKQSVFYKNAAAKKDNDPAAKKAVEDYDNALAEAKRVLGDKNATKADVEKAKEALEKAEKALHADTYATDSKSLAKALADNFSGYLMPAYFNAFDKAQAGDEQAKKDFKAYNDAYHAAKDLMDELNKPGSTIKQTDVDKVKQQLLDARKIIDTYATDTSRLSAAVFNDIAIKASPAYKNLKALAEKTNPTPEEQADVEAAKKAMEAYKKAADKLHNAITNKLPRDKANGQDIPDSNIPVKDGDLNDKDYLKDIQAHKNGEPLNRDVDDIIKEMNAAAKALDKFATKTDELIKSINEDANTHPSPAFKNASLQSFQKPDGSGPDVDKNNAAKAAADAYGEALNKAKEKLNDPNATQKDINDAKAALDNARKELDKYNTDITKLEKSVSEHGKDAEGASPAVEGTKDSDAYRNASDPHFLKADGQPDDTRNNAAKQAKADYDKALAKAQELLNKADPKSKTPLDAQPTQQEVNEALKKLDEARTEIEKYKTDTTKLDEEAKKSQADGATSPTTGQFEDSPEFKNALAKKGDNGAENPDVTAYKKALATARERVKAATDQGKKNSERPTQQEVDEALDALKKAKQIIADTYKTNATALQDEAALGADDGNFTKSPEYKNAVAKKGTDGGDNDELKAYKAALTSVKTMLNNFGKDGKPKAGATDIPTQDQVDSALEKLSNARKAVEAKYATKTNKLENEVGDKDETGQPVTPPFEASVPYKNALEKAKTEDPATTDPNSATAKLKAYADKLKDANDLIEKVKNPDPNAKPEDRPTQDDVDKALAALKKAKKDIDDAFKTNASALKNEAEDKDERGNAKADKDKFEKSTEYTNALAKTDADSKKDVQTYKDALKKANELLELFDENGNPKTTIPAGKQIPSQKEVDEAQKALKEIKDKILANYKTSPNDLYKEVDKSKNGEGDTSTDVFENTPAFKNVTNNSSDAAKKALEDYNKKLQDAKDMLEKFDRTTGKPKPGATGVPTQKELDDALKALQDAKKKITDEYSTNKSDLRTEAGDNFTNSPEYQNAQAKGDDASKQALDEYQKALDEANSVLNDPNANQAEVDAALKRLQDAKSKLKAQNSTDKSKLQAEADDDANFRNSPYFIIGNKADIEAYENALAEANSVLNDPNATQAQVDAALRKLQAAKAALLNSLTGASGHKIAKTGAATGLFAGFAAIFAGLGAAGVASRRRKHSKE